MDTLKQIFNDPSVVAVVSGLVAWLVAHLTGVIKVLEGGNISVQQVKDAAEKLDPAEYARVVAELESVKARAEAVASSFETRVQQGVDARLRSVLSRLDKDLPDTPAPSVAPPAEPPAGA